MYEYWFPGTSVVSPKWLWVRSWVVNAGCAGVPTSSRVTTYSKKLGDVLCDHAHDAPARPSGRTAVPHLSVSASTPVGAGAVVVGGVGSFGTVVLDGGSGILGVVGGGVVVPGSCLSVVDVVAPGSCGTVDDVEGAGSCLDVVLVVEPVS